MTGEHACWLAAWIERGGLALPAHGCLRARPMQPREQRALLRLLNDLESRFDEVIAQERGRAPLDWGALREELQLAPDAGRAGLGLLLDLRLTFTRWAYPAAHIQRGERLWRDFLFLQEEQLSAFQVAGGWLAALDYLLQGLYFTGDATQEAVARRHGVSPSTLGLRYRALVEALGLTLFDHPARKRLLARRALAVESGAMSEGEFNRRLLRGEPILAHSL